MKCPNQNENSIAGVNRPALQIQGKALAVAADDHPVSVEPKR
jgi:hypothetical protein